MRSSTGCKPVRLIVRFLMKSIIYLTLSIFVFGWSLRNAMAFELNYDKLIPLDAEELAENGIGRAYESLIPKLKKYGAQPQRVEELVDDIFSGKCLL